MIDRNKYEKISDQVMVIANRVVLKMNVQLSYYGNENKRHNFHREVEYYSNKSNSNLINMKRVYDYYLTIEHTKNKDYIRIGITDIFKLQHALEEAYKFFTDSKYQNLYAKKEGELIIYQRVEPIVITGLSMDKFLQFEPVVYEDFRGELQRGLRMYLSSNSSYCDISIRSLEGFIYIIQRINLFESAQAMLSYVGRPEFGTNLYSYNTEPEEGEMTFQGKDGRQLPSNKVNLSYFDKMKDIE